METVRLTIDGLEVEAAAGANLLDASLEAGIYIPHLCHHPDLTPSGSCRLCMVDVNGRSDVACRVPAEDGQTVSTETPEVTKARKVALELILADHPLECLPCSANGKCELQRVSAFIGHDADRMARLRRTETTIPPDTSNPFFDLEMEKCVLCGICVRTCDELQNVGAIDFTHRGMDTRIGAFADQPIVDSSCVSCGECVVRCPVGALVPKTFEDPAREAASICPFCGVGCGFFIGTRGNRITHVRGDRENPANRGSLCVKGRFGLGYVNSPDRLTEPLVRENGALRPATWDEALTTVTRRLTEIKEESGAGAFAAMSSAKCSNEENYLLQKFTRVVMGTNNIDHCART